MAVQRSPRPRLEAAIQDVFDEATHSNGNGCSPVSRACDPAQLLVIHGQNRCRLANSCWVRNQAKFHVRLGLQQGQRPDDLFEARAGAPQPKTSPEPQGRCRRRWRLNASAGRLSGPRLCGLIQFPVSRVISPHAGHDGQKIFP